MLLVSGTTWTRFRARLAASLLTMIAGRVLRISPPRLGSKATHQTSPRRGGSALAIRHVPDQGFGPFLGFGLAHAVGGHRLIAIEQSARGDQRPGQVVDEAADAPRAYVDPQALVNILIDGDGKLLDHGS